MAGMDSEQIIGSCNAAGMHFVFKMRPNIVAGSMETWRRSILSTIFEAQRHGRDGQ
jgi:hypothetical protein